MNSGIHSDVVLEELVLPFAAKLREVLELPASAFAMYMEDESTTHTGDKNLKDGSTGWQEKRKQIFRLGRVIRHLYSRN